MKTTGRIIFTISTLFLSASVLFSLYKWIEQENKHISLQRKFFASADIGNVQELEHCLRQGIDINTRSDTDYTALMYACGSGHLQAVKFLLDRGANPTLRASSNYTALIWAAEEGHTEVVSLLLQKGVNINDKLDNGETALLGAIALGRTDMVRFLLKHGANKNDKLATGVTALEQAEGHPEIIKLLKAAADEKQASGTQL